ncbi:MAG: homocysteine S-methyltransferase family protein [Bacteroidales bacterium]|nr:homocysteine S-methyltransferase family protein [Bacteroidales bacterium]
MDELQKRVLILDGGMGSVLQSYRLSEQQYRGELFKHHTKDLKGLHDVLNITQPSIVMQVHLNYLEAGSDIIETNTFNSNKISLQDYNLSEYSYKISLAGAQIACNAVNVYKQKLSKDKNIYIAGSIGPSSRSLSLPANPSQLTQRYIQWDEMIEMYIPQIEGLIDGGVDFLLVETAFDPLNVKAIVKSIHIVEKRKNKKINFIISATVNPTSMKLFTGQELDAFVHTMIQLNPLAIGVNCSLSPKQMSDVIDLIHKLDIPLPIIVYPNAGLPDENGCYTENINDFVHEVSKWVQEKKINIIGGCCGTTPKHIAQISKICHNVEPRQWTNSTYHNQFILTNLKSLYVDNCKPILIGERTNIFGSSSFNKAIQEGNYIKAIEIAREQIKHGAHMLDINVDDPTLPQTEVIKDLLFYFGSDSLVSSVPWMIDTTNYNLALEALKYIPGRATINSLSLKDGEQVFLTKAYELFERGASFVVMLQDEYKQAILPDQKKSLTIRLAEIFEKHKFNISNIIIDIGVLALGTKKDNYFINIPDLLNFLEWLKATFPQLKTICGLSNLTYAFRNVITFRRIINKLFFDEVKIRGIDFVICNPKEINTEIEYNDYVISVKQTLLNKTENFIDELIKLSKISPNNLENLKFDTDYNFKKNTGNLTPQEHFEQLIMTGEETKALQFLENIKVKFNYQVILDIIIKAMQNIGQHYENGKIVLPEVLRSASVVHSILKKLQQNTSVSTFKQKTFLLATVKGDVHDIGKNIASMILQANGYNVIDLGVNVDKNEIVQKAQIHNVDAIGLSGLISPSLYEMLEVAISLKEANLNVPLLLGGAAVTEKFVKEKISKAYNGIVLKVKEAPMLPTILTKIFPPSTEEYDKIQSTQHPQKTDKTFTYEKNIICSNQNKNSLFRDIEKKRFIVPLESVPPQPKYLGIISLNNLDLNVIKQYLNVKKIISKELKSKSNLLQIYDYDFYKQNLLTYLDRIIKNNILCIRAKIGLFRAQSTPFAVRIIHEQQEYSLFFLRSEQLDKQLQCYLSLADFVSGDPTVKDHIGLFIIVGYINNKQLEHEDLATQYIYRIIINELIEASSEYLHTLVQKEYWGYDNLSANFSNTKTTIIKGIRPAPGYPCCPDHSEKKTILHILDPNNTLGVTLTENYMLIPETSICGYYFANPNARYFNIGKISNEQLQFYASLKKLPIEELKKILIKHV